MVRLAHRAARGAAPMTAVPSEQMDDTEKSRPPEQDVRALWERISRSLSEIAGVWAERRIDVEKVENQNLARELPEGAAIPPWARIGTQQWSEHHRLILPMYDSMGHLASLHARAVSDSNAGWCERKAL